MKRFLYAFGIIALVALVIGMGYFFRYQAATPIGETGLPEESAGSLPQTAPLAPNTQTPGSGNSGAQQGGGGLSLAGNSVLSGISNRDVNGFAVKDGVVSIVEPSGQIVRITNNKEEVISASPITSLIASSFSADGKKVVATFLAGGIQQSSVFDMEAKSWSALPQNARGPVWSPFGATLAYLRAGANGGTEIITHDLQNSKSKPAVLFSLSAQDMTLAWPSPNTIVLSTRPSARIAGSIMTLDIKNKTLALVADDERGATGIWNTSSTKGLVLVAGVNSKGGSLSIRSTNGSTLNQLALMTLPSKCVFGLETRTIATPQGSPSGQVSSTLKLTTTSTVSKKESVEMLYCGIPRDTNLLANAELPDDYLKNAIYPEDNVFKIDLKDGAIEALWADETLSLDMSMPKVSDNQLYFVNRFDKKLYALKLVKN